MSKFVSYYKEANFSVLLTLSKVELVDLIMMFYIREVQVRQKEKERKKTFNLFLVGYGEKKGKAGRVSIQNPKRLTKLHTQKINNPVKK